MPDKSAVWIVGGLLLLAFVMYHASVGTVQKKAADGYRFEEPTLYMPEFMTKMVVVNGEKELVSEFEKLRGKAPDHLAAFAIIRPSASECVIYIVDPKISYAPEFIGHELVHCLYGEWHNSQ